MALLPFAFTLPMLCGNATPAPRVKEGADPLMVANQLATAAQGTLTSNPAESARLSKASLDLATRAPLTNPQRALAIATSLWLQGESSLRLNNTSEAERLINEALKTASHQPGSRLYGELLVSRAGVESSRDQVERALADYQTAFVVFSLLRDSRAQAVTLQDIGLIYQDAGDPHRALNYFNQAADTFSGDPALDLSVSTNRANTLDELGRFQESQREYARALALLRHVNSPSLHAQILNNLAIAQMTNGYTSAARATVASGLRISQNSPAEAWRPILLGTSARLALETSQLSEADALLNAVFASHNEWSATQKYRAVHYTAYLVYKRQGDSARALRHFELYQSLADESRKLVASTGAALMTAQFDFSNQNASIATLKASQLRREIVFTRFRARQNQVVLGGLLASVTVLVGLLVLYLRSLRQRHDSTRSANERLQRINMELEHALNARSEFLATTSHEIRTPLNGVLGITQVLLADVQLCDHLRDRLILIHGAGETMRLLVDDLLDLSKIDAGPVHLESSEIDLPILLREICQFWQVPAQAKQLELLYSLDNCPSLVQGDVHRLRQILTNILSNAIKFTGNGRITLVTEVEVCEGNEQLIIKVEDTGIGIPIDSRDRVFEKFIQLDAGTARRYSGVGLGLAIARNLARAMGGDITVANGTECGSVFSVTLPLRRVQEVRVNANPLKRRTPLSLSESGLLIVEPNPIRLGVFRAILEREVASLMTMPTIVDALDYLANREVDVLLMTIYSGPGDQTEATMRDMVEFTDAIRIAGARALMIVTGDWAACGALFNSETISLVRAPISRVSLVRHLQNLFEKTSGTLVTIPYPALPMETV